MFCSRLFQALLAPFILLPVLAQSPPKAVATTGVIRVKTDQVGAVVFLNDKEVGRTPLTLPDTPAGKYRLTLVHPGYAEYSQEIECSAGKPLSLFVVLKVLETSTPLPSLPVSFVVIHGHTSGSCKGVLLVNRDTIEYKADNGTDHFEIPIRSVRLVSRYSGSEGGGIWSGVTGGLVGAAMAAAIDAKRPRIPPVRIDAGRAYNFLAVAAMSGESRPESEPNYDAVSQTNEECFRIVNRLFTDDLKVRPGKR